EALLDDFYKSHSGDLGVIRYYVTPNEIFDGKEKKVYNDSDFNRLITDQYAGHHGKVTLLTKHFGRGVDFQSETSVNEKGGIHVIQTFFSSDIKEEIQIKGRTARKDEFGSYELIICLAHMEESVTKITTYEELDRERNKEINSSCTKKLKQIQKVREAHEKTLEFLKRAANQCNENNQKDYVIELHKGI
ncbi:unnamed protein product, partial [Rotaria sordida]